MVAVTTVVYIIGCDGGDHLSSIIIYTQAKILVVQGVRQLHGFRIIQVHHPVKPRVSERNCYCWIHC